MFNNDDFNFIKESPDAAPDGLIDASDYQEVNERITDLFSKTDFLSVNGKMEMMMNIMNMFADEDGENVDPNATFGVVLALTFHLGNIFSNLQNSDPEGLAEYFEFVKNEMLPAMREESSSLPYWEM